MKKSYLKIIAVLVIVLLASVSMFAQEDPVDVSRSRSAPAEEASGGGGGSRGGGMMFAVKVGIGISNIFESYPDSDVKTGYGFKFSWQIGARLGYFFGPIGILVDVEYIRKGSSTDDYYYGGYDKITFNLDYIDVNLMFAVKFGNIFAGLGIYAGFKINSNLEINDVDQGSAEYFKDVDFGLVLTVGMKFGMFFVGLDIKYGFTDIVEQSYKDIYYHPDDRDVKTKNWGLYLNFGLVLM